MSSVQQRNEAGQMLMMSMTRALMTVTPEGKQFMQTFYDRFLMEDGIPDYFAKTDMAQMRVKMRLALLSIIKYVKGMKAGKADLEALKSVHGPGGHHVAAALYPVWLSCFLASLKLHDLDLTPEGLALWERTLQEVVDIVKTDDLGAPTQKLAAPPVGDAEADQHHVAASTESPLPDPAATAPAFDLPDPLSGKEVADQSLGQPGPSRTDQPAAHVDRFSDQDYFAEK